jgi:hypothetical protein
VSGTPWTPEQTAVLIEHYGKRTCDWIARRIGRGGRSVYLKAAAMGIARKYGQPEDRIAFVRQQHAAGLLDSEICRAWNQQHPDRETNRRTINYIRMRLLKLPVNESRRLEKRREGYRSQMAKLGIAKLPDIQARIRKREALRAGFPADLRPLEVRIASLMADGQYRTRQEIAAGTGVKSDKQRKWFSCRYGSQSALDNLVDRGLLKRTTGRIRRLPNGGNGRTCFEYWMPLDVLRKHRQRRGCLTG